MGDETGGTRQQWIVAGLVVIGAVAGGVVLALGREQPAAPAPIVVAVADRGPVTLDVATIGTVEPATTRNLSFGVDGTVAAVTVQAGNRVVKGQRLATLDGTDTTDAAGDAASQLSTARARLSTAKAAGVRATANAGTCTRATRTPTADATLTITPPEAITLPGSITLPGATALPDVVTVPDATPLPDVTATPGVTPSASTVTSVPRTESAEIRGEAAAPCTTVGFPDTGNDPVLTAEQQVNRATRAVQQAAEAQAGTAITAPIAGIVVAVAGSVGDRVRSGAGFVTLAGTHTMQVRADFPEADAGALTTGLGASITLADSDTALAGHVIQVDPAGTSDGTLVRYGTVVSFDSSPTDLLVGQSARVKVRVGAVAGALRVPSTAVHDVSSGAGTVLLRSGGRSTERLVTVGLRGDQYTEILDGLSEGDQVIRSW
ncbi:MAG TPA: HlyD family efflux transporter periplasmic adaptor subunit [Actinoplanes sp.]|nr:HlyD family efflux transporter periplasmic adaptor subunit [Actinoplanes sp.]